MHAKVLIHRYGDDHHASRDHIANQGDRHKRRRSVLRESLDDVHVDREEERQQAVAKHSASGSCQLVHKFCYLLGSTYATMGLQNEDEEKSDQASQKRDTGSSGAPIMAHQSMASGPGWSLPLVAAFWYSRPMSIP